MPKPRYIEMGTGEMLTLRQAAISLQWPYQSVVTLSRGEKNCHVETLVKRRIAHTISSKIMIVMENGDRLNRTQASQALNIPYDTIYRYTTLHLADTEKELVFLHSTPYHKFPKKKKLYHSKYGKLAARELYAYHEHQDRVTIESFYCRLHKYGGMSEKIWEDKHFDSPKKGKKVVVCDLSNSELANEEKKDRQKVKKSFNRVKFCKQPSMCKHYKGCSDSRSFYGYHSDRYVEDGSCWECINDEIGCD